MTISIPDTLTTDNSEKYIVSIRLRPGGFSFSGYIPSVGESFFYREAELDRAVPYTSALKELFFAHEFLTWTFKRTHVVCMTTQYTFLPREVYDKERKNQTIAFNFAQPEKKCLSNFLKDAGVHLVFGIEEEVYEFCTRTLTNPSFIHHLTPQLVLWRQQSLHIPFRQMYVVLHQKAMDLVVLAQGKLLFANTFQIEEINEAIYYILYVWQLLKLDQQKDQLFLFGDSVLRKELASTLRIYIRNIQPMQIPSETYLMGANIAKAPMDLISLLVCEL